MKKADVIIIICAVLIGLVGSVYVLIKDNAVGGTALIYIDGDLYQRMSLNEDQEVNVETIWGSNTIGVENGYVYMVDADCKDQLCLRMKPINEAGAYIVCLPHHVHIEIESSQEAEVDAVSN